MQGIELQAIEVKFDGAPGVRANQVAEIVGELAFGQGVDVVGKVAKSRLGIEGVRMQNKSWGGWWGLLRVAASSNIALYGTLNGFTQTSATITGTDAGDTIVGGTIDNIINGGGGADIMNGGAGGDIYLIAAGDHGAAEIADTGSTGTDAVPFTSVTAQTLTIYAGDTGLETVTISDAAGVTTGTTAENIDASLAVNGLTITGNDGVNTLKGTGFADTINGGAGDDYIIRNNSSSTTTLTTSDTMIGGTGEDYMRASDWGATNEGTYRAGADDLIFGGAATEATLGVYAESPDTIVASGVISAAFITRYAPWAELQSVAINANVYEGRGEK